MSASEPRHAINGEVATAKVIDGEAIVINVVTGRYYSLEGAGALAWTWLAAGATVAEAAAVLASRFGVDEAQARQDVAPLADELVADELLVRGDGVAPGPPDPALADGDGVAAVRGPYAPPKVVRFTDMEDLLAFDPPLPPTDAELWPAHADQR
jgi:Coenzyme PQQ synthesis protein D (PqqD)